MELPEIKLYLFERQSEIIKIQSEVIDDLFRELMQRITPEEAEHLQVIGKINEAARIRAEIDF